MGQSCCAQHTFDTHELDNLARTRYMKTHPNCEIERELTSLSSELLEIAINKTKIRKRKLVLITAATSPIGRALCGEFASKSNEYIVCGIANNTKHIKQMTADLDKISSTIKSLTSLTSEDENDEGLDNDNENDDDSDSIKSLSPTTSEHDDKDIIFPDSVQLPNIQCVDVCNEKKVALWIMDIFEEYGIPDIIINNSTIIESNGDIINDNYNHLNHTTLSYDEFVSISDTNVTAYFHLLKYLMPSLIKRKQGMIINLTGTSQSIPTVFKTAYETSKFAMEGYVESLSDKLFREKKKSQMQQNMKLTLSFNIAFVTMSVGSLDMKSQRILCGFGDNEKHKTKQSLKEELLKKEQDDRKENNGKEQGVTFQRWATKTLPIIIGLGNGYKFGGDLKYKNEFANVERIVDLNTMLKSKYSK